MQTIELKTAPELKRLVLAAFPSYKKHNVFLSAFSGGQNINSYWDGGSRSEYAIVELTSMRRKSLPTQTHPFFDIAARGMASQQSAVIESDRVGNLILKVLPEGFALVEGGTFCGKTATVHIYLNPENMTKFLAA